ncbi:Techylectin-5B [Holothuria leucospilota]|uniref:Techylectin-5B n=1 Tax=Holothuria leucospilota TaxID=206669 RepID=A0A9Q1C8C9_HOLLE|nr:Techylectin-5B [Holothuria leucospilota]
MAHHNGRKFSTRDQDNDDQNGAETCAEKFRGGWWYGSCMKANLNGIYLDAPDGPYPTGYPYGLAWLYWHGTHEYSLKRTEMKIRKVPS